MKNPSLDIIVTEHYSTGGCPLEEACEHCYLIQSVISVAISYIISVYCEDYAGYFTVILSFLAFHFHSAYFIYLVSCTNPNWNTTPNWNTAPNWNTTSDRRIDPTLWKKHTSILGPILESSDTTYPSID
jgi:hypothetical protein